jgi:hypothetical protein
MRLRFVVPLAACALSLAVIAVAIPRFGSPAVSAQTGSARPLLYNEIAEWCPFPSLNPAAGACDTARFETLTDGSVRVVLDINPGNGDDPVTPGKCVAGIAFPDDVTGSAYVLEGDRWGVLDLTAVRETSPVCEFVVRRAN